MEINNSCSRSEGGQLRSAGSEGYTKKACRAVHDAGSLKINLWQNVVGVEPRSGDLGCHERAVFAARQRRLGHKDRPCHLPASHKIASQHQIGHRPGIGGVRIGRGRRDQMFDGGLKGAAGIGKPRGDLLRHG